MSDSARPPDSFDPLPPSLNLSDGSTPPDSPAPQTARPVATDERIRGIDVLRGVALLGILPVNMIAFAHVEAAYQNPLVAGGFTGGNFFVWLLVHVIFENKMITTFSLLFGVGLFLQVDRAEKRLGRVGAARGLFYRRVFWLLLFGLIHAYLFWFGDILTHYALIGMLVYPMRRLRPRNLLIVGFILILLGSLLMVGLGWSLSYVMSNPEMAKEAQSLRDDFNPSPEKVEKDSAQVRAAGFFELAKQRAGRTFFFQIMALLVFVLWRITGLMLCGIALVKTGGLTLEWSQQAYYRCMTWGFGIGVPLTVVGLYQHLSHPNDMPAFMVVAGSWDYFGTLAMALGYFGVVMLMVKNGWLVALQDRLAAVGQMALTNYLMQTLICTFIFNGWGLAQFGKWTRTEQFGLVLSIWLFQLIVSPIWLSRFRFGPMEWLWRSLTYWQAQPMRKRAGEALA